MTDGEKLGILLFVLSIVFLVAHGQSDCRAPIFALYCSILAFCLGTITFMASGKKEQ